MTTPKAIPIITKVPQDLPLDEKIRHIGKMNGMLAAQAAQQREANIENKVKYIAGMNKKIEEEEAALAEEARQNLERLDQQLAESNKQALAKEARQNLERLDQQLAKSNKQALAKEASENLERLDQQLAESNKQALAQGKLQDRARIDEAVKDAGLNNPAKKAPEAIAQKVDNGNASKGAKASDLLNNSDKETIGVEKKVSAEAIRQKIEVLNEQVERLNEQKGDLSAEELQKLEKINKRQAELNAKVEVSDLLNNSDKETIGVEKKVSAEAIRQKIEVLNEQVERLNEQKGDLSAEELQKLEKINERQAKLNEKAVGLLNNSGDNAAVNANLPKKNQAQGDTVLDQSKEARAERQKTFAKKQEARIARAHQNAEIIYKKAEALAHNIEALVGRVYKKLGALNAKLDTLNTQEDLSSDEKARAEKIRQKIERIEKKANDLGLLGNPEINAALAEKTRQRIEELEKKANDLGLLGNPEKNPALAEKVHKKLGELNATLEIINKHQSLDPKKDVTLSEEARQNPARPNKQQAQAPDLLKNSGKTESQESSKEGKGLLSRAFHFVQRMFKNVLAEEINDYRAEKKDHSVAAQIVYGDNTIVYNTSFVRINEQKFNLEPGKDFHRQSGGVDIRITYDIQHTVPGVMNLNINGTKCDIQPGKFARYREHGLKVDVVYGHQQNMNIGQSSTIDQRNVENVQKKALEHGTVLNVEGVENVQAEALKDIKPSQTPTGTEKKGGEFCMRL